MPNNDDPMRFGNLKAANIACDEANAALKTPGRFFVFSSHDFHVVTFAPAGPYVAVEPSVKVNAEIVAFCTRTIR